MIGPRGKEIEQSGIQGAQHYTSYKETEKQTKREHPYLEAGIDAWKPMSAAELKTESART